MMSRQINVSLNVNDISKLITNMDKLAKQLKEMGENVVEDLSDEGLKEMQKNYANSQFKEESEMQFEKTGEKGNRTIQMVGQQAIYSEFGTGSEGEENPHPIKNEFDLKPYNSGKTIRKATAKVERKTGIPEGGLYWTYKDSNGQVIYTQGVPAQKIVYNADEKLRQDLPSICKKRLEEVINDIN